MQDIIRILHLEDSLVDAELIARMLRKGEPDCVIQHVETREAFIKSLEEFKPDIILADYQLPDFDGMQALAIAKTDYPEIPFIFVTGKLGEDIAVDTLKKGASDYIIKDRMTRLVTSIRQALEKKAMHVQRLASENALAENQALLSTVFENVGAYIYLKDTAGRYTFVNAKCLALWKLPIEKVIGATDEDLFDEDMVITIRKHDRRVLVDGETIQQEEVGVAVNTGKTATYWAVKIPLRQADGTITGLCGISTDITERKQNEINLQHTARALASLSAVNRSLVHANSEKELLGTICADIVKLPGYKMAWVGYVQDDEHKSIKKMMGSKGSEAYLEAKLVTWDDTQYGMGPTGRAIRSGQTQFCPDIAHDAQFLPWRDAAIKYGYASSVALPLLEVGSNKVFGTLNVYADVVDAFMPNEIELLEQMAGDIAFGVHTLHIKNERNLAIEKTQQQVIELQDSLDDTVRAIASIGELRDPYTAGHQLRVAKLATAIAMEMQLPEQQVHAIQIAATVHDLGKIMIPAEILSKPGRITDIEYSLIKGHPQAGYDILKGIDFPWPIAQMVLQHHERLDGSGYPQGLKGNEIILEARILAVADVVEAMSSHRPYRAELGIDVALDEVMSKRYTYYDSQAVDACVAVFREKGFTFES